MKILSTHQNDAAWIRARTGMLTASRMVDVLAVLKRKEGESAARRNYRLELISERLTGRAVQHYVSQPMLDGSEKEPFARAEYEVSTGYDVRKIGLVGHPFFEFAASSPDALVNEDGGLELKSPKMETHCEYLMSREIPAEYIPQMVWNMACTGRKWWDFCSYHPDFPDDLRIFVKRLYRDEVQIEQYETAALAFEEELQAHLASIGKPNFWKREIAAPAPENDWPEGGLTFSQMADLLP